MQHTTALLWFRRTLRVDDNRALVAALQSAKHVVPVFILDPAILTRKDTGARRVAFMIAGLRQLDEALRARGSYLVVRHGNPREELGRLAQETGATALFFGREYEPWGRERDRDISASLRLEIVQTPDHLLIEPEALATKQGTPYTVFTPYFRSWAQEAFLAPLPAPEHMTTPAGIHSEPLPSCENDVIEAGEAVLSRFLLAALRTYDTGREFPSEPGTSQLAAYLKFGLVSARRLREAALRVRESLPPDQHAGVDAWVRQLAWRDFYYQILFHFPAVATGSFKPALDGILWENSPQYLEAWQQGETGYPFVDAALRQLRQTGWMHNRARMAVASFLTKDLLCDWRIGEQWFMEQLIDGDQAANNGGWQWAAGTGTDAQPYFRIFNPVSQGEKFDPEGRFVKRWCPELKAIPPSHVHKPWELPPVEQNYLGCVVGKHYPTRIVEHALQRERALTLYQSVAKGAPP